jgi:hypothetical protein
MTERRVRTLEKITEAALWSLPEAEMRRHLELAPRLPDECLRGARVYADREAMLHALRKGGVVGEVGTFKGEFSALIARICKPEVFHLFDVDFGPLTEPPGMIIKHLGDSSTRLSEMPEGSFDWLYIDGDHSYDGVVGDLAAAHRAIKPGGLLMCNDYANWCSPCVSPYGVARAVNELIIARNYAVEGFAFHPASLPDILIRKPE